MQRLASRILIVVALFVLLVVGILIARGRATRTEAEGPRPSNADLTIKEVQLQEESTGGLRWHLVADQASVYEQESRTRLRNIRMQVEGRERTWTITAAEGDLFNTTKDFVVRTNVVVISSDGLRLETSVLRWVAAQRKLWTDAPVRISRQHTVILGSAFAVDVAEEVATVEGRVHATFAESES